MGEICGKVREWEKLAANDQIDTRLMFVKKITSGGCLPLPRGYIHVFSNLFFSEIAWLIKAIFYVAPPWKEGTYF